MGSLCIKPFYVLCGAVFRFLKNLYHVYILFNFCPKQKVLIFMWQSVLVLFLSGF
jgi:hypothetical protein